MVRHADEYLSWSGNSEKQAKYILLGAAKHDSGVIADYAKKYVDAENPGMKKLAVKITDSWDKKSTLGKAINRTGCVGRSVRNVLNRLTFR